MAKNIIELFNSIAVFLHRRSHRTGCTGQDPTNFWDSNMGPPQNFVAKYWFTTQWTLPSFQPRRRPCVFVFIGFPRLVDKTKIYNFKNKKKHILQYGFFMPCRGMNFTFLWPLCNFWKLTWENYFRFLKKMGGGVCVWRLPVGCSWWWHAPYIKKWGKLRNCFLRYDDSKFGSLAAGGIGAPSGRILIDSRISTSTWMDNSGYALQIPK